MIGLSIRNLAFGVVGLAALLPACSNRETQFAQDGSSVYASRVGDGTVGEFDAGKVAQADEASGTSGEADAGAGVGTDSGAGVGTESGAGTGTGSLEPSGESNLPTSGDGSQCSSGTNYLDSGLSCTDEVLVKGCLEKLGAPSSDLPLRVEDISSKNMNNKLIFADPVSETKEIVLLRLVAKNVNHSQIHLLNPNAYYCIDMRVKNMNTFRFRIACEGHVGFVRLERKNGNKSGVDVQAVTCK